MKRDIVFLHGGTHGSWCWQPLLQELRKNPEGLGRLIALDMPGAGTKRERTTEGIGIRQIAQELNGDVRAAGARAPVLVGHSIAGLVLPMMVLQDTALFSQVIHLTTIAPSEGQTNAQMMGGRRGENPDEVGFPLDHATTSREDIYKAIFCLDFTPEQTDWLLRETALDATPLALMTEPVTRKGYAEAGVPTSYIVTLRDPILPPRWQREFSKRHCATEVVEIDTPHEPMISHPALLAATLRNLLAA